MSSPVDEATVRMCNASHAFGALLSLLHNACDCTLEADDLYYLLQPIKGEVDAALDELKHA